MSDREFDNYLALLSRLLRLGDKQRDAIAGELRTHLEDRLDELLARGVSRDEAIRQALEEFGDAALLAAEFASIRGRTRKRWIMRLATASVAAIVLIAAGIFTFWPGNNAGPGAATSVAQTQEPQTKAAPTGEEKPAEIRKEASIKDILERRMAFTFSEKPLASVVQELGAQTGITIYLDARHLEEAGVNRDTPVTHGFSDIRLRTFLDLMLGELELTYMVKDDVLFITTPEYAESPDRMVVRVYDCRELLALSRPPGSTRPKVPKMTGGGGGFFAVQDEPVRKPSPAGSTDATTPPEGSSGGSQPPAAQNAPSARGFGSAAGGLAGDESAGEEISDAENLIRVITTIVDPASWNEVGGPGGIAEYKGLLTVAATQAVHEKVERLLNMLHQAGNLKELKVTVVE